MPQLTGGCSLKYSLLFLFLILSGCSTATVPKYSASEKDSGDLALVKAKKFHFFSEGLRPWIKRVITLDGEEILTPSLLELWYPEVYLRPGTYIVTLECTNGYGFANPLVVVNVEAGRIYETTCHPGEKEENIFGMKTVFTVQAKITDVTDR